MDNIPKEHARSVSGLCEHGLESEIVCILPVPPSFVPSTVRSLYYAAIETYPDIVPMIHI